MWTQSWRGSPLWWQSRSRMVRRSVATGSCRRNSGITSRTGRLHSSLPSSTSSPSPAAVKDLVIEHSRNCVSVVTGRPVPVSRTP
jgi:hypothetical protein